MAVYGGPPAPLDLICGPYFGPSRQEAMRQAACGELPVKVFRVGKSQKAPYMVKLADLAVLIDEASEKAEDTWKRCQVCPGRTLSRWFSPLSRWQHLADKLNFESVWHRLERLSW